MLTRPNRLDFSRTRVLVVDDSPSSAELIVQMLLGFRAREPAVSPSAAEAKRRVASERFDLLVVDGEMPNEDGLSFVRHVRSEPEGRNFTSPILLVSAHTPLEKITAGRDAGANLVLKKPVAPQTLLSRIAWLARVERDFINCPSYRGPDRRFRTGAPPPGVPERRADTLALTADATRALSQDDVDNLFG